jgi:hypothetical protein
MYLSNGWIVKKKSLTTRASNGPAYFIKADGFIQEKASSSIGLVNRSPGAATAQ